MAVCYFGSGAYLHTGSKADNFGMDRFQVCSESGYLHAIIVFLYVWPLYIRFMQNMRQQYDSVRRRKLEESAKVMVLSTIKEDSPDDLQPELAMPHSNSSGQLNRLTAAGRAKLSNAMNSAKQQQESKQEAVHVALRSSLPSPRSTTLQQHQPIGYVASPGRKGYTRSCGNLDDMEITDFEEGDDNDDNDDDNDDDDHHIAREPSSRDETFDVTSLKRNKSRFSHSESFRIAGGNMSETYTAIRTLWWRYVPSWLLVWPYSYNALKYLLSMMVVLFGAYPPTDPDSLQYQACYLTLCAISTSYSIYWDMFVDWQLWSMTPPNYILREPLYYGETEYFYYIVIISNAIFRSFWTLSFTPYGGHSFLVVFEILRRSLWSCLRMEVAYIQEINKRK
jgi:hypothetical protein